jgi:hypothetical protein
MPPFSGIRPHNACMLRHIPGSARYAHACRIRRRRLRNVLRKCGKALLPVRFPNSLIEQPHNKGPRIPYPAECTGPLF